jgi:hypothetical protein
MLGSNSRWLPDPEHGENVKVNKQMVEREGVKHSVDSNKYTEFLPLGESPGGLFIWVVRGPVIMSEQPPNHHIYTECIVMGALQLFHTPNYFT